MAQELKLNKEKEKLESHRSDIHVVDYVSNNSNDWNEVYSAEFVCPSEDKSFSCASLKPASKGRQEELKFTFDISKCDPICDELLKLGNIKISHTMPPLDEIKQRAYCKYHHSYSYASNVCNVFRRKIQSAINEGRLILIEKQFNKHLFPINTRELQQPKVLVLLVRKVVPILTSKSAEIYLLMVGAKQLVTRGLSWFRWGRTSSSGVLEALYCVAPWCLQREATSEAGEEAEPPGP
jgi:hypothetical protein